MELHPDYTEAMDINQSCFTPRFAEACRREGMIQEQLIKKSREEVIAVIRTKDPTG